MEKIERWRLRKNFNHGSPTVCANCGEEGVYRVTFEDRYSKLAVTLCEECARLKYGQLKLQSTFDWPGAI